jgi:hypothetical protein
MQYEILYLEPAEPPEERLRAPAARSFVLIVLDHEGPPFEPAPLDLVPDPAHWAPGGGHRGGDNLCLEGRSYRDGPSSSRLIELRLKPGVWASEAPPPIAVFRKQLYVPLREAVADCGGERLLLLCRSPAGVERAKAIVALDLLARQTAPPVVCREGEGRVVISATSGGRGPGAEGDAEACRLDDVAGALDWRPSEEMRTFWERLAHACSRHDDPSPLSAARPVDGAVRGQRRRGERRPAHEAVEGGMKPLPTVEEGLRVFEFFSGIGGMRLALPTEVAGVPIRHVTAFDCSAVANQVYARNFDSGGLDPFGGELVPVLIDGLTLREVDGRGDIWTMSPPCQPYTTTRGACQRDARDQRSRGIFHLMSLLRAMRERPGWIVLENVRGFHGSDTLREWKATLRECGYRWAQVRGTRAVVSDDGSVGLLCRHQRYVSDVWYMVLRRWKI